jgi:hypothetical protein
MSRRQVIRWLLLVGVTGMATTSVFGILQQAPAKPREDPKPKDEDPPDPPTKP